MPVDVVELFAGAGGLTEGLRMVAPHLTTVGLEHDHSACRTRVAAGHPTIRTDVAAYPTEPFRCHRLKLIAGGPPCQTFSAAGDGEGRRHIDSIKQAARLVAGGADPREALAVVQDEVLDDRTMLVLQPLRWVRDLMPEAVLLEEVPQVLPVWEAIAHALKRLGYHTWTGKVSAEQYGVPQARERGLLLASLVRVVHRPPATHRRYVKRLPDGGRYGSSETPESDLLLGDGLLPWLSMYDGVGWGMTERPYPTVAGGRDTGGPDKEKVGGSAARAAIYAERDEGRWVVKTGNSSHVHGRTGSRVGDGDVEAYTRPIDHPAPTVDTAPSRKWRVMRDGEWTDADEPPPWTGERPATTVTTDGSGRMAPPGYRGPGDGGMFQQDGAVRITLAEAAALQTFPPGYPFQGTATTIGRQIGNAVPCRLAAHAAAEVLGLPAPTIPAREGSEP